MCFHLRTIHMYCIVFTDSLILNRNCISKKISQHGIAFHSDKKYCFYFSWVHFFNLHFQEFGNFTKMLKCISIKLFVTIIPL